MIKYNEKYIINITIYIFIYKIISNFKNYQFNNLINHKNHQQDLLKVNLIFLY